jgi:hypothetical protein
MEVQIIESFEFPEQILTASASLPPNTPIIECKGKLMLASQFRTGSRGPSSKAPLPYVFFYQLGDLVSS